MVSSKKQKGRLSGQGLELVGVGFRPDWGILRSSDGSGKALGSHGPDDIIGWTGLIPLSHHGAGNTSENGFGTGLG
jgi:hypothetical protein